MSPYFKACAQLASGESQWSNMPIASVNCVLLSCAKLSSICTLPYLVCIEDIALHVIHWQ